jgi:hypothetical protein
MISVQEHLIDGALMRGPAGGAGKAGGADLGSGWIAADLSLSRRLLRRRSFC